MRKVISVMLTVVLAATMATGCGKSDSDAKSTASENATPTIGNTEGNTTDNNSGTTSEGAANEVEKPEKITIMTNGTFYTQQNGQEEWVAKWEELTGIELEVIQPDHSSYYDVLSQTIASGNWPDVVLLNPTYYASYAQEDVLWDMTKAWESSELRASFSEADLAVQDSMYLNGHIYGLANMRGNGCVTYVKKAWLDKVGLQVPTNFEQYLEVCKAFSTGDPDGNGVKGDTYALSAAGLISPETPWINYLPEFYQDAYPSFYKNSDGTWADGFTEEAMVKALERLRDAYQAGYIDPESLTNATSDVRNKFYENKTGIFTYWAGKWANTLASNLSANGYDDELVALPPIAEVGKYIDRSAGGYSITTACENPEGVYKYFIETMFDGGDIEGLWNYGVEGVHYSTKAETVCGVTYEEGQLHGLESLETPGVAYSFNSTLLLFGITDEFKAQFPIVEPQSSLDSQVMFNNNSRLEDRLTSTDAMEQYNGNLVTLKNEIIANVVTQGKSIEEEMQRFKDQGGAEWSQAIVDSLNAK